MCNVAHVNLLQGLVGCAAVVGPVPAQASEQTGSSQPSHKHNVQDGHREQWIVFRSLRHVADPQSGLLRRQPEDADFAPRGPKLPEEQPQEGRLAAAIGPNDADRLALANRQAHVLQHGRGLVGEADVANLDHRIVHRWTFPQRESAIFPATSRRLATTSQARSSMGVTAPSIARAIEAAIC